MVDDETLPPITYQEYLMSLIEFIIILALKREKCRFCFKTNKMIWKDSVYSFNKFI